MTSEKKASTSALLLRSIDVILHEIVTMENAVRDAPREVTDNDRRHLRRNISELRRRSEELMNWLGEVRLETTKH